MSVSKGLRAVARSPSAQKGLTAEMLVEAGYPAAGTETGESFARKLSAVDRCIEILSDSMGKLPCFIMDGRSRERVDLPILQLLNVRPNEAMTPFIRKKVLETSRLVNGNGYDWIVRDGGAMAGQFWPGVVHGDPPLDGGAHGPPQRGYMPLQDGDPGRAEGGGRPPAGQ